jgi:hypothetical protein
LIELLNVLKFVVIIFISLSYFKSQIYMKIMRKNLIGIANIHIYYDCSIECWNCSDYVIYIFSFYYRLWKKTAELQLLKKIWLWSSFVTKIFKMKYNLIDIKWRLVSTSFKIYLDIISTSTSRSRSVITTLLIYFTQVYMFFLF